MFKFLKTVVHFLIDGQHDPARGIKEWERIEGISVKQSALQMRENERYKQFRDGD